ncbi:hypothetical protein KC19_11G005100 [Ceratodon purpureus]|uniref:Secreted protein n=1 Tax=Ceratodon purpureus TaxID=3225 RepID=A0A8T0GF60_CERPU|nr:hypothetical protein KC19_11G005100 [Ceratodon purpureus]
MIHPSTRPLSRSSTQRVIITKLFLIFATHLRSAYCTACGCGCGCGRITHCKLCALFAIRVMSNVCPRKEIIIFLIRF